jgi:hypothetical protein
MAHIRRGVRKKPRRERWCPAKSNLALVHIALASRFYAIGILGARAGESIDNCLWDLV